MGLNLCSKGSVPTLGVSALGLMGNLRSITSNFFSAIRLLRRYTQFLTILFSKEMLSYRTTTMTNNNNINTLFKLLFALGIGVI